MIMFDQFPELRQNSYYDCGANAVQSILAYYGHDINGKIIKRITKTNKKTGTPIKGIIRIAKRFGIKTRIDEMTMQSLKKDIKNKKPVMLLLQAWSKNKKINWETSWKNGHYAIAIGYDKTRIYFEDPSSIVRTYLTFKELKKRWHGVGDNGEKLYNLGIIFYGKKPNYHPNRAIKMK